MRNRGNMTDKQTEQSYRYPLLLTGTIDSGVYNNTGNLIKDISERLSQYENAIAGYIKDTPFDVIVFIENSGYKFNSEKFEKMAISCGKEFEFISGKVCVKEIMEHGKSYGDAYLITEALKKSKLLETCEYFYKITGRIFLKNSKRICKTVNKYRNEFIVYMGMGWCLTNIFKANKKDYLKVLGDVYNDCDEVTVNDIEISFYKRLMNANIELGSFETYPYFEGVMGATGRSYSGKYPERILRNVMARLHCFTKGSLTSKVILLAMKLKGAKGYE